MKNRRPSTYGAIVERLEFLEALKVLTDNDGPLCVENDLILAIVNDTFDYATADCERVPAEHVRMLADLYEEHGSWAVIAYVALKRNRMPIRPVLNDERYVAALEAVAAAQGEL